MIPRISIIVPAYNAAKTLPATIKSVLKQTLADFELIVVDDGSSDETLSIAQQFAQKDARVIALHKENGGGYDVRRFALSHIKGGYFGFVDADDVIRPDMYEKMVTFADAYNLDVAQCDIVGAPGCGYGNDLFLSAEDVYDNWTFPILIEGRESAFVWNKIYRNKPESIGWEPSRIMQFDDLAINLQVFSQVTRMGLLHEGLYDYQINAGSSVRNFKPKNIEDFKEAIRFRKEYCPKISEMCRRYKARPYSEVMSNWVAKNAWNFIKVIASAPNLTLRARVENARKVLEVAETEGAKNSAFRIFFGAGILPGVMAIRIARKLKAFLK